jgi:hypothetical protein
MLPTTLTNSYFIRIAHSNVSNTSHFLRRLEGAVVHLLTYIAIPGLGTEASRQAGKGILYGNIYLLILFIEYISICWYEVCYLVTAMGVWLQGFMFRDEWKRSVEDIRSFGGLLLVNDSSGDIEQLVLWTG